MCVRYFVYPLYSMHAREIEFYVFEIDNNSLKVCSIDSSSHSNATIEKVHVSSELSLINNNNVAMI